MESDRELRKPNPATAPYVFWDDIQWPLEEESENQPIETRQ